MPGSSTISPGLEILPPSIPAPTCLICPSAGIGSPDQVAVVCGPFIVAVRVGLGKGLTKLPVAVSIVGGSRMNTLPMLMMTKLPGPGAATAMFSLTKTWPVINPAQARDADPTTELKKTARAASVFGTLFVVMAVRPLNGLVARFV